MKCVTVAVSAITAVVALGVAPAQADTAFDPLAVVKAQGVLGSAPSSAPAAASAKTATTSSVRPVDITPTNAGLGRKEAAGTNGVFKSSHFGVVVGAGQAGGNAAFIAIRDAAAPQDYSFVIGDASTHLVLGEQGLVSVVDSKGSVVNFVQAPWAVDASGKQLATTFTVSGNVLTQHVSLQGAAFPVVADPQLGCTAIQCSIYWNHSETHDWATAGIVGLGGATAACGIAGPEAIAVCGIYAAAIGATAIYADNHHKCVGFSISPLLNNPFVYTGRQCK